MTHGRRFRVEKKLGRFLRQYGRRGRAPHDSNDRGYDRKLEEQLKRLEPEELDLLLRDEEPTPSSAPLNISFDPPHAGWLRCVAGDVEVHVSHTPNDFLRELVTALLDTAEAYANEEPRRVVVSFRRPAEGIELAVDGDVIFTGTRREVVLPFWRALRRLQRDWPASEWQWAFQERETAQLDEVAAALKR